ncbi:MAG: ABC transporter permease, partial [Tetragenococcus koreensis]
MEDTNYTKDQLEQIPSSEFEPLEKSTKVEREAITAPSLNFLQDSWRRLKKNKAAVFSSIFLLIVILISVVTIFATPHDPTEQNVSYINLPPKIPGIDINGLNGVSEVGGQMVDKYEAANVPDDVHFYLGTDGLGRDLL